MIQMIKGKKCGQAKSMGIERSRVQRHEREVD
jgi:hypothetical protein